jgi:hypothetical protein
VTLSADFTCGTCLAVSTIHRSVVTRRLYTFNDYVSQKIIKTSIVNAIWLLKEIAGLKEFLIKAVSFIYRFYKLQTKIWNVYGPKLNSFPDKVWDFSTFSHNFTKDKVYLFTILYFSFCCLAILKLLTAISTYETLLVLMCICYI